MRHQVAWLALDQSANGVCRGFNTGMNKLWDSNNRGVSGIT